MKITRRERGRPTIVVTLWLGEGEVYRDTCLSNALFMPIETNKMLKLPDSPRCIHNEWLLINRKFMIHKLSSKWKTKSSKLHFYFTRSPHLNFFISILFINNFKYIFLMSIKLKIECLLLYIYFTIHILNYSNIHYHTHNSNNNYYF